jgi:predicted transcriptional regulator
MTSIVKSETLTIRVTPKLKEQLTYISTNTKRSLGFLAFEALSKYAETETEVLAGILVSRQEIKDGKGIPHSEVMLGVEKIIKEAYSSKNLDYV